MLDILSGTPEVKSEKPCPAETNLFAYVFKLVAYEQVATACEMCFSIAVPFPIRELPEVWRSTKMLFKPSRLLPKV